MFGKTVRKVGTDGTSTNSSYFNFKNIIKNYIIWANNLPETDPDKEIYKTTMIDALQKREIPSGDIQYMKRCLRKNQ